MATWLARDGSEYIARASPSEMRARHGDEGGTDPFIGADGNAVSNTRFIFSPDLSAVQGQPLKYWENVQGDAVSLKSQADRDAADADEAARITAARLTEYEPLVGALAELTGKTEAEVRTVLARHL